MSADTLAASASRNLWRQINARRAAMGLTVEALGDLCDMNHGQMSRVIRSKGGPPKLPTIARIAAALGCEPWELLAPVEVVR